MNNWNVPSSPLYILSLLIASTQSFTNSYNKMKQDKFYAVFCYEYDGNMVEVLEQESTKKEIVFETNNH